jgi:hypothetical protein
MEIILTCLGLKCGCVLIRIMAYIMHTGIHGVFRSGIHGTFFHRGPTVTLQRVEGAGPERKSLTSPISY